jgi:hypothetical protein
MSGPDPAIERPRTGLSVAGRLLPLAGGLACAVCCSSLPFIGVAFSAAGIGFLRNDRLLIPLGVVCYSMVLHGFLRARSGRHSSVPRIAAVAGAGASLIGMWYGGIAGGALVVVGTCALVAATYGTTHGGRWGPTSARVPITGSSPSEGELFTHSQRHTDSFTIIHEAECKP